MLFISQQMQTTYTALLGILQQAFQATSAAQVRQRQAQLDQINANLVQQLSTLDALLEAQRNQFGAVSAALATIRAKAMALQSISDAAIREYIGALKKQQAIIVGIMAEQDAIVPELNALTDQALTLRQGLLNANRFVHNAPRNFTWNDIALYVDRISTGDCPARWVFRDSDQFCNAVWYDPASWFQCIRGQWIGLRYFLGRLYSYVIMGEKPFVHRVRR